MQESLDLIWIIIAASLVMLMQAGFAALETGLTRAKNSINVAIKNLTDFVLAILIFYFVGYGLMFGESADGWFGTSMFALSGLDEPKDYALFIFQAVFAGTAATIVSGAVAERIRFVSYAVIAIFLVMLIYPVSGHWIWHSEGWLAQMGMVDFAGSTVVHSLGGWVGLAGAIIVGPRLGRFEGDKVNPIQGHNLVMAVVGVMILWFGWIGFNGGSTLAANSDVAVIVLNTMLAAGAGGFACFMTSLAHTRTVNIEKMINGVVGGLVSITAGCAVLEPSGAILVGLLGGVVVYLAEELILRILKVDDPVNVVSAHGVAGAWGTLALALFAPVDALPLGDRGEQFLVQLYGVVAVMIWGLSAGWLLFSAAKYFGLLRVSPDGEKMGLNYHEHQASSGLFETMNAMNQIIESQRNTSSTQQGDLTKRIEVEPGSESGDVARLFNDMMDAFHDTILQVKNSVAEFSVMSKQISATSEDMDSQSASQLKAMEKAAIAIKSLQSSMQSVSGNVEGSRVYVNEVSDEVAEGRKHMQEVHNVIQSLSANVQSAGSSMYQVDALSKKIGDALKDIRDISEQTTLLSLNAAIESARAGEAGRGFAIVADEVRYLSNKVANVTDDIEQTIQDLLESASKTLNLMDQSENLASVGASSTKRSVSLLEDLEKAASSIRASMESISNASISHSDAVADVQTTIQDIEKSSSKAAQYAEELNQSTQVVDELSGGIHGFVSKMKVDQQKRLH